MSKTLSVLNRLKSIYIMFVLSLGFIIIITISTGFILYITSLILK